MDSFLDEAFLRRLETLRIMAQKGIKGSDAGIHRSHRSGSSLEFMDYRKYHPGDDIRYVDWNVYGRTDRLFIKLFHAEKDLTLHILVDTSGSMGAGTPKKIAYAKKIVAALSYIGLAGQDQVGVTSFSRTLGATKSPERGKDVYWSVLNFLSSLEIAGPTDLNASLEAFAASGSKPGMAVVVSDFLDPMGVQEGLKALVHAKFKVKVIQVLDRDELTPAYSGSITLQDMETGRERQLVLDRKTLARYTQKMAAYLSGIEAFCRKRGIDYHLANTRVSFEEFFLGYLGNSVTNGFK